MRWGAYLLFLLSPALALAQPAACVDQISAWSIPYSQGSIQAITYVLWQQAPSLSTPLLSVLFRTGEFHLHVNVPQGVAQQFTGVSSADGKYNSLVKKTYKQALLTQTLCPLINETGDLLLLGQIP